MDRSQNDKDVEADCVIAREDVEHDSHPVRRPKQVSILFQDKQFQQNRQNRAEQYELEDPEIFEVGTQVQARVDAAEGRKVNGGGSD